MMRPTLQIAALDISQYTVRKDKSGYILLFTYLYNFRTIELICISNLES